MDPQPKDPNNPSGPVVAGQVSVTIDRDLCIGAATCMAIAPEVFVLDSDAKAIILPTADNASPESIVDAAKGCPTAAIIVTASDGTKLYPA